MKKIVITGDFTTEERGRGAVLNHTAIDESIMDYLQCADYSIINLEAPVLESDCKPIDKVGPNLKTIPEALGYLKSIGVKAFTLANNHFYDYGENGVKNTIDNLKKRNLDYVGGGCSLIEIRKPLRVEWEECRLTVLNYCETEFSIQDGIGSNQLNPINCYYDIDNAKKESDIIIVITHGGHEGYNLPSPRMQDLYRFFIDCGADMIVNHHQHCYSGYEKYNGGVIYYGLGNFYFDAKSESDNLWNYGFMICATINNKKIEDVELIPYEQCKEEAVVRRVTSNQSDLFFNEMNNLNNIIEDRTLLEMHFDEFCVKKRKNYLVSLSPYNNRILKALAKRKLLPSFVSKNRKMVMYDYVCCEAHRDVLIRSLSK